ncbi:MAG: bifunctional [glutamine synthetase] adenylyltransferase/[glutamine synthetase]-adenylyl-L-tyrosine phosphorylase [Actinomycetaceae bacterium]|nr:bifunctional [glutamine synthetase] adenylyltransferase/[glutamine synthetase]-adenylyl-L-tyrosine phosphorylase [Actinomycetaceae bacterium]
MSGDAISQTASIQIGFADFGRTGTLIKQLLSACQLDTQPREAMSWFESSADPDAALLTAIRLAETDADLTRRVLSNEENRTRFIAVSGASVALATYLESHPNLAEFDLPPLPPPREAWGSRGEGWDGQFDRAEPMIAWLRAQSVDSTDSLRAAYWRALLLIAAEDVTACDRVARMDLLTRQITDLVDATLQLAYELACATVSRAEAVEFAVIAMGKTGGQELNYISDVDVIYLMNSRDDSLPDLELSAIASQIATAIALACSGPGNEPPLWTLDAGLRPEGRDGALVRTIESCATYYRQWAKNWEFQALMKARPCAGDAALGERFLALVDPLVWRAATADGFVDNVRDMRQTVEANIPLRRANREIKLGRGGLRDVEFTVQLLQLVHGRTDETLRVRNTLLAIELLSAGGYIARTDAVALADCYRFLRTVEHRAQLSRMRRTHLMPTAASELRKLARAIDPSEYPTAESLERRWQEIRDRVRNLHEAVFYRPLVEATAQLSSDHILMTQESIVDRLAAFGYRDPAGALRHVEALTQGTTRRATIQRHLLPVMLGWLANGADPDMGLLNFRRLSDEIGSSHWYLALLRDSAVAARRLCDILPTSTFTVDALMAQPECVKWLDTNSMLAPRDFAVLNKECAALLDRHEFDDRAIDRIRYVRNREVTRAAIADVTLGLDPDRAQTMLTPATDAALLGALDIALATHAGSATGFSMAIVAMGRYGGREASYGSDADIMFVHDPGSLNASEAQELATTVAKHVVSLLTGYGTTPSISVDIDLRPEGKNGPLSRTLRGYVDYWNSWAATWEKQALLRARPIGDTPLDQAFIEAADTVRYAESFDATMLKDIRLLKARMENERLPRGIKPSHHVKLGPGGLSDVEWLIQVEQMRHGHTIPAARTTSTLVALDALENAGVFSAREAQILRNAWNVATNIRAGNVLATGRTHGLDILPRNQQVASMVAAILGYDPRKPTLLSDDYLRLARHARRVFSERMNI